MHTVFFSHITAWDSLQLSILYLEGNCWADYSTGCRALQCNSLHWKALQWGPKCIWADWGEWSSRHLRPNEWGVRKHSWENKEIPNWKIPNLLFVGTHWISLHQQGVRNTNFAWRGLLVLIWCWSWPNICQRFLLCSRATRTATAVWADPCLLTNLRQNITQMFGRPEWADETGCRKQTHQKKERSVPCSGWLLNSTGSLILVLSFVNW